MFHDWLAGETRVLPCKVVNRLGPLQWTKDGFGLGITWELNGFGRYRFFVHKVDTGKKKAER